MSNTQSMCTSFLGELLSATHNFSQVNVARTINTADTFKVALYFSSANINAATTVYTTTGEVTNTSGSGYTAGGVTVTNTTNPASTNTSSSAGTGYWTPSANFSWTALTITSAAFNCVLLYNSSQSNKAVAAFTFGDQTITSGTLTLTMPSNVAATALLRLATT